MIHTREAVRRIFHSWRGWIIMLLTLVFWFPAIETRFFPVMQPAFDMTFRAVQGGTMIAAKAPKVRGCDWRRTIIYLGDRDLGQAIPVNESPHLDPPEERVPGVLQWDLIFVPLPRALVEERTHADTWHNCYRLLTRLGLPEYWTRSQFF